MAFCQSCGQQLADGVKFCDKCGAAVGGSSTGIQGDSQTRTQAFAGTIRKCASCGAVLLGMVAKCPECGWEITGQGVASSVKEFSDKLLAAKDSNERIQLIQNFPIPNSTSDITEFILIIKANFKPVSTFGVNPMSAAMGDNKLMSTLTFGMNRAAAKMTQDAQEQEAWHAKASQLRDKIELLFASDTATKDLLLGKLDEAVNAVKSKMTKKKLFTILGIVGAIVAAIILIVVEFSAIDNMDKVSDKDQVLIEKEETRMSEIETKIRNAISEGNYIDAELYLSELKFNDDILGGLGYSKTKDYKEKWENKKQIYQKQIDKANSN